MRIRSVIGGALLALLLVQPLDAVSVRDIVELSRAGLSDEILVALIEMDDAIFSLDAAQLRELSAAGVSERVILAMLRSGRPRPQVPGGVVPPGEPGDPVPASPSRIVESDSRLYRSPFFRQPGAAIPLVVTVPVPVVVPLVGAVSAVGRSPVSTRQLFPSATFGRFINDGFLPQGPGPGPPPTHEPVYWGWGGELRPDAWGQPRKR